jgi:succinate dehydrogenase/fumarate reductase flavoprotein subunit
MKSEYDVVVVGGGGSGLAAAVSSAESGLEVLLLDCSERAESRTAWRPI